MIRTSRFHRASDRNRQNAVLRQRYAPGRMTLSYELAGHPTPRTHRELSVGSSERRGFQSVLVPLDGTPFAEHALPRAIGIARRSGGTLRLVHVTAPMESPVLRGWSSPAPRSPCGSATARRSTWRASARGSPASARCRSKRPSSSPISTSTHLVDAASGCDLVVIATHGRGPFARFVLRSTADALLRRIETPVLLVRGYNAPVDLTGDPHVRHVLVALDGTPEAEQVVEPALRLGKLSGADYTLLRIAQKVSDYYLGRAGSGLSIVPASDRPARGNYPWHLAKRLRRRGAAVQSRIVHDDRPICRVIVETAESAKADLIAMTTHGHRGLSRWIFGSLTDQVVRAAAIPILVCRSLPSPAESPS